MQADRVVTLTENHPLQDGLGPGSPLQRLIDEDGRILLLGSPLAHVTLLHYTEYLAEVPNKKKVRYRMPLARGTEREWVEIEELDSSTGIVDWPRGDYFEIIVGEFIQAGLARSGKVGHADSHLLEAAALHAFGKQWMDRHLPEFSR